MQIDLRIDSRRLSELAEFEDTLSDSLAIRGAIPEQVRRLDDKLMAHNRIAVDITSGPLEKRTALYPIEAVQQITRNAVMHRTYEGTNAPVRVYWYNETRIEVVSPGGVFGAVTAENFGEPGLVDYRNPNLADAMKTFNLVQRFGVGISITRRLLKKAGHPAPKFKIDNVNALATIHAR